MQEDKMVEQFEKDFYQFVGRMDAFMTQSSAERTEVLKELGAFRHEIYGAGDDGGLRGRLKTIEVKLYIVGGVAMMALSAAIGTAISLVGGAIF